MTPLFKKLNYKDQSQVFVLNAPPSFTKEIIAINGTCVIRTELLPSDPIHFGLFFVTKREEITHFTEIIVNQRKDDAIIWFVYPKTTSKNYAADFNRDSGWEMLRKNQFESVRMVSVDEDWSAFRFRHTDYIKEMNRKF